MIYMLALDPIQCIKRSHHTHKVLPRPAQPSAAVRGLVLVLKPVCCSAMAKVMFLKLQAAEYMESMMRALDAARVFEEGNER